MRVFDGRIDFARLCSDLGRNFDSYINDGMKWLTHSVAHMAKVLAAMTCMGLQDCQVSLGT